MIEVILLQYYLQILILFFEINLIIARTLKKYYFTDDRSNTISILFTNFNTIITRILENIISDFRSNTISILFSNFNTIYILFLLKK